MKVKDGLALVPIGVFASLVFPSLFVGEVGLQWKPLYLFASLLCLLIMKVTKNFFFSFITGISVVIFLNIFN